MTNLVGDMLGSQSTLSLGDGSLGDGNDDGSLGLGSLLLESGNALGGAGGLLEIGRCHVDVLVLCL
jgi:hypothetical protein